jgi:hypothetical protein
MFDTATEGNPDVWSCAQLFLKSADEGSFPETGFAGDKDNLPSASKRFV